MEMERVLSMSGRLQKLLTEAQAEADQKVNEAQKIADEIIETAKTEANRKRLRAQRGSGLEELLAEEEKIAEKEAIKVTKDFENKVEELRKIPTKKINEAIKYVLQEVLPE